jgi:hypothetical protein
MSFWKVLSIGNLVAVLILGAALSRQLNVNRQIIDQLGDLKIISVLQQEEIRDLNEFAGRMECLEYQADILMAAARSGWNNAYRLIAAGVFGGGCSAR